VGEWSAHDDPTSAADYDGRGPHALARPRPVPHGEDDLPAPGSEPAEIERGAGRPEKGGYRLADGSKAVSVTNVLGMWGEKEGLLRWAAKNGMAAFRMRDDAAAVGTCCHDAIQAWELGDDPGPAIDACEDPMAVVDAFCRWRAWRSDDMPDGGAGLTMLAIEVPLVSESMRIAGTPDFVWLDRNGELTIGDLKTGRGAYVNALYQCALYALMWSEIRGEEPTAITVVHVPAIGGPLATKSIDGARFARVCKRARGLVQTYHDHKALAASLKMRG